ncbi:MAG TPA: RluA family pseudouridine synthase [Fimbriimonadaceae bacterium]|nr:RluA family pseudouridine synthase [Fimbriimonadaceae bacterium]
MKLVTFDPSRLDVFLAANMEASRSRLVEVIDTGGVKVDGRVVRKASFRLEPGMTVEVEPPKDREPHNLEPVDLPLDIRYESEAMIVVNKARAIATHPAPSLKEPSLVNVLLHHFETLSTTGGPVRPGIVHRLDKDTTGLIMVAKTDYAHEHLSRQIQTRTAERRYLAWVKGVLDRDEFVVDAPIARDSKNRLRMTVHKDGKPARTQFSVVTKLAGMTLLEAKLETGRTHQVRVHLKAIGHPVIGDSVYGGGPGPLQLHAYKLRFIDPLSEEVVALDCESPSDFEAIVR